MDYWDVNSLRCMKVVSHRYLVIVLKILDRMDRIMRDL